MIELARIIAIRHGETDWNTGSRLQGQMDVGLNERGRWQAAQLASALADEGLVRVYASDLARAWDTAKALADPLALPLCAEPALRERHFGGFEGSTYEEIQQRWPEQAERWRRRELDFAPEGGESLAAFSQRCVKAVLGLSSAHAGQAIALVCHGGVLDCLYRFATGLALDAPRSWPLPNGGINRLLAGEHGLSLVGWCDTSHLDEPWPHKRNRLPSDEDSSLALGASTGAVR